MSRPKAKKDEKQQSVSIGAYPAEIARWKAAARADNRPLAQWLRLRLLAIDAQDNCAGSMSAGTLVDASSSSREPAKP